MIDTFCNNHYRILLGLVLLLPLSSPGQGTNDTPSAKDAAAYRRSGRDTPNPLLGKPAPKWEVDRWYQLPEGTEGLDIADFRDKVVYIYCFQSWCPGCHKAGFPSLKATAARYEGDDAVRFVAIQTVFEDRTASPVNTFENLKKVAAKFGLKIPFAQSGDVSTRSAFMTAYLTRGTPWTIIVDRKGLVRYSQFHISTQEAAKLIDELKREVVQG